MREVIHFVNVIPKSFYLKLPPLCIYFNDSLFQRGNNYLKTFGTYFSLKKIINSNTYYYERN
jgi:hypothetical protein